MYINIYYSISYYNEDLFSLTTMFFYDNLCSSFFLMYLIKIAVFKTINFNPKYFYVPRPLFREWDTISDTKKSVVSRQIKDII